ncbi:MAG: hypothetical protein ACAI34_05780 [Verrucomicrobium sp.]|nr:hypothetical protein [Verrucomicrobium sp.]
MKNSVEAKDTAPLRTWQGPILEAVHFSDVKRLSGLHGGVIMAVKNIAGA